MRAFVAKLGGIVSLHCVGHSLGGAVASLAADWIKANTAIPEVNLYTFGSPRVGLSMFAQKCTDRLLAKNIYRAYHKTDPVAMVPTWPFIHLPDNKAGYLIYSPVCATPWEYHFMKNYIKSVTKTNSWEQMKSAAPQGYTETAIKNWLQSDGLVTFSVNTLDLLNAALIYVIEKVIKASGILLTGGFATAFTLLDRMAMFMAKAEKLSVELGVWVRHLVVKMASIIGVVVDAATNLTVEFIRVIFVRLHHKISEMIWKIGQISGD